MKPVIGFLEGGKGLHLDLPRLLKTRLLIQAGSGGGKSWLLRRLLEQTNHKVQQIVIDTEGEFSTLRSKFDYVICAPSGADAIATPNTAALLAKRLRETRASAIIDIYELKLPDRRKFVRLFVEEIMDAPKKFWHPLFLPIDEAQLYCPESGKDESESKNVVIDATTRGRKRGICVALAVSRLAKLSKDAAAECHNKLIGLTGLVDDIKRAADELGMPAKEAIETLRNLDPGEFFAFGPSMSKAVVKVMVGDVHTPHGEKGKKRLHLPAPSSKIKKVLAELKDLPQEAEQERHSIEELQRELRNVKREYAALLRNEKKTTLIAEKPAVEKKVRLKKINVVSDKTVARLKKALDKATTAQFYLATVQGKFAKTVENLQAIVQKIETVPFEHKASTTKDFNNILDKLQHQENHIRRDMAPITTAKVANKALVKMGTDQTTLPKGEKMLLQAIAQHTPPGCDRQQLTVLTGFKRSTRDAYLLRLFNKGLCTNAEPISVTQAGVDALGTDYAPLPTGDELRRHWLMKLPEGEKRVLDFVCHHFPTAISRDSITTDTGYKRSTRDAYIQRLEAKKLVVLEGRGAVSASKELFG